MPFNGSGVFNRLYSWVSDAANGIKIRADRMDNEMNGMATGLTDCVTRDGQSPATANLPMGGFIHTNVGDAASIAEYPSAKQVLQGAFDCCTVTGGTANAVVVTSILMAAPSYALGQVVCFEATANQTAAATINRDGLGVKSVLVNNAALPSGCWNNGDLVVLRYDGTAFQLISPVRVTAIAGLGTAATKSASNAAYGFLASIHTSAAVVNQIPIFEDTTGSLTFSGIIFTNVALYSDNLASMTNKATCRTSLSITGNSYTESVQNPGSGYPLLQVVNMPVDDEVVRFIGGGGAVESSGVSMNNVALYSDNLASMTNKATCRTSLGLGTAATSNASASSIPLAGFAGSAVSGNLVKASGTAGSIEDSGIVYTDVATLSGNLAGLASLPTSRGNIGFATHTSTPQTGTQLNGNAAYSEAHGLDLSNGDWGLDVYIENISPSQGYSVGDFVKIDFGGSSRNDGLTVWANASTVGYSIGTNGIFINPKGGGGGSGINTADWELIMTIRSTHN